MVVRITELKLDDSINDCKICINGYTIMRRDQNRKGGGVVCYASNKICFNTTNYISNEIENIFIELFVSKTKPITAGIIYKLLDQLRFLETLSDSLKTVNILNKEWHILGDLNINLCENGMLIKDNNKNIVKGTNKISLEAKNI